MRELQNVVERALIRNRDGLLMFQELLMPKVPAQPESSTAVESIEEPENQDIDLDGVASEHIRKVLRLANGRIHGSGGAAERLHINPSTLRKRMDKLGIPYKRSARPVPEHRSTNGSSNAVNE